MLQLLVNRFTILTLEECKDSDPSDTFTCLTSEYQSLSPYHSKWKKRLSLCPIINTLDAYETFFCLPILLKTINISQSFSVHALVSSGATRVFIN